MKPVSYADVDGLGFAAERGLFDKAIESMTLMSGEIGPLVELISLYRSGLIPHPKEWLSLGDKAAFVEALEEHEEAWVSPDNERVGFIRSLRQGDSADLRFTNFLMSAKRAARLVSKLSPSIAGQFVAAMKELESNVHEHSKAPDSGFLAYEASAECFQFVIVDSGIGILNSLRSSEAFGYLTDEGEALQVALKEGVSRHGVQSGRGYGFRPIFIGLTNRRGLLRFRSGDHAIFMDGTSPNLASARVSQKATIRGFFASVKCQIK